MSAKGFDVRRNVSESLTLGLVRASHPKTALVTAVAVTAAAGMAGRSTTGVGVVFATVLAGQGILGWHNDLVDRERDARHDRTEKPLVSGVVEPGTVWFAMACGVLLVVPLSIANGVTPGLLHLGLLLLALATNAGLLRRTPLSWVTWAATFALWPPFLSYAGSLSAAPTASITALTALLGVGVHFAQALPGLVADNQDKSHSLPLLVALKVGAPRLLIITVVYLVVVSAGLTAVGLTVGLRY
jgi:4-hydroxybenzoate polyprenyltransferase